VSSYALNWLTVLPLEIIAASITIGYWNNYLDRAIFVTLFLVTIITINLFGVKGYGEAEFVLAIVKVTAVIGFMLVHPSPSSLSPPTHIATQYSHASPAP
jgi:yeast amino acid transporter